LKRGEKKEIHVQTGKRTLNRRNAEQRGKMQRLRKLQTQLRIRTRNFRTVSSQRAHTPSRSAWIIVDQPCLGPSDLCTHACNGRDDVTVWIAGSKSPERSSGV